MFELCYEKFIVDSDGRVQGWKSGVGAANYVCAATGCATCKATIRARRERRDRARAEQMLTVDQLKTLGVSKFRQRTGAFGATAEEAIGFLGDLRFIVGPHGSIKLEGYIDPDKAVGVAKLFR